MALKRDVGVADEGRFGPITLRAVRSTDPHVLTKRLSTDRLSSLTSLNTWKTFGKVWPNSLQDVEKEALKMASPVAPKKAA